MILSKTIQSKGRCLISSAYERSRRSSLAAEKRRPCRARISHPDFLLTACQATNERLQSRGQNEMDWQEMCSVVESIGRSTVVTQLCTDNLSETATHTSCAASFAPSQMVTENLDRYYEPSQDTSDRHCVAHLRSELRAEQARAQQLAEQNRKLLAELRDLRAEIDQASLMTPEDYCAGIDAFDDEDTRIACLEEGLPLSSVLEMKTALKHKYCPSMLVFQTVAVACCENPTHERLSEVATGSSDASARLGRYSTGSVSDPTDCEDNASQLTELEPPATCCRSQLLQQVCQRNWKLKPIAPNTPVALVDEKLQRTVDIMYNKLQAFRRGHMPTSDSESDSWFDDEES